jgi:hypothetical protein
MKNEDILKPARLLADIILHKSVLPSELVRRVKEIAATSQHHHKMVRLASVEAMRRIDPRNATFTTRLTEMSNYDNDGDVKKAASNALQDSIDCV